MKQYYNYDDISSLKKPTSLSTLIVWNISKALKMNSYVDLKCAIRAAQERLEHDSRDVDVMISQCPEERHLACALLAWQQLGHRNADSLYEFIETKRKDINISRTEASLNKCSLSDATCSRRTDSISVDSCNMGPVVKLPTQTNIVMRIENAPCARSKKTKIQGKEVMEKLNAACCLDSACLERLSAVDKTTSELRSRAAKLAKRESERVELLERAEAAWRDLESGYQRRLGLAEEKEDDMAKQIQTLIDERNGNKNACTVLAQQLKERGDLAEKERAQLTQIEKDVYDRACTRLCLSEDSARGEAALAEQQCRAAQLDRDLQYKEEQARRKIMSLESEAESARMLTHEAERAMRAELGALREQIAQVSNQLLDEDKDNSRIKLALEQLREEKRELVEDLDGCKVTCDGRMQGRLDELKTRREHLNSLKEKVMECRCKLPVDEAVEVKRTPSLAALCRCSPEDKLLESCSCTSLRSRLLSNLLSDLFGGLQAELGGSGTQMPCQLLKCLEDKHNWDRASNVKTNLKKYFSKLLISELDIAIATAIEKYHAKWVGASCADQTRMIPALSTVENEEWQERSLERKAQQLASQLAEQLFKERAEQLEKRVKDIVSSELPPCKCFPTTAAFTCMVKQKTPVKEGKTPFPAYWQRTHQDVTLLRMQLEDLKKESIGKDDLKLMEENISKIVQRASAQENNYLPGNTNVPQNNLKERAKIEVKSLKANTGHSNNVITSRKPSTIQKKTLISSSFKKDAQKSLLQPQVDNKTSKLNKKFRQEYAVNMCLCSNPKANKQQSKVLHNVIVNDEHKDLWKQKCSKDVISQISSIKQTKPINTHLPSSELATFGSSKHSAEVSCLSNCVCFHKLPSTTSIDKLLDTLTKWKCDLEYSEEKKRELAHQCILNTIDINDKLSTNCSTSSKKLKEEEILLSYSRMPLNNSKFSFDSNKLKDCKFKHNNVESVLPAPTESEYMGAINLDKSNENFCKCIQGVDGTTYSSFYKNDEDFPLKCLNSTVCACEKSEQVKEEADKQTDETLSNQQICQNQNSEINKLIGAVQDIKNSFKNESSKDIVKDDVEHNILLDTMKVSDKPTKDCFPQDCDYLINFLGITLTNTNCVKDRNVASSGILQTEKSEKKFRDKNTANSMLPPVNSIRGKLSNDTSESKNCNYKDNFEELKNLIREMLDKKMDKDISLEDKSLDTETMQLIGSLDKNCICCNNSELEESQNLEENTFQLIADHLKEKLDEFKVLFCKSSCISPTEEEKLFTVILHRIKEVISVSTKEAVCRCSDDEKTKGSWNRAYGLLQEYLKMKLKRVQCLCGVPSLNNDMKVPLDDVLQRVCLLIEKDFDRLKKICHCDNWKNKNPVEIKNIIYDDLPEKDINKTYNLIQGVSINDDINIKKLPLDISKGTIILTQNISSQVPQNLGMENKSCYAMEQSSKNIQTRLSKNIVINANCNTSLCNCSKEQNEGEIFELLGSSILCNSHCTEMETSNEEPNNEIISQLEKHNTVNVLGQRTVRDKRQYLDTHKYERKESNYVSQSKIPYVGNTVDCSCEGKISYCVCMKSIVEKNNDKIMKIWKMFTQKRVYTPNISYIMHSDIDRSDQENNDIRNLTTDIYENNFTEFNKRHENVLPLCDTETNALRSNGAIVLKTSIGNFNRSHVMTNTFNDDFSNDGSNNDNVIDWYDFKRIDKSEISYHDQFKDIINIEIPKLKNSGRVNILNRKENKKNHLESKYCGCSTVPVCHVKLLMESIENKLVNMQCTCDSLVSKVCPVHAGNTFD